MTGKGKIGQTPLGSVMSQMGDMKQPDISQFNLNTAVTPSLLAA
jgi:hypothetical protein